MTIATGLEKPLVKLAAQSPEAKKWLPALGGCSRAGCSRSASASKPRHATVRVAPQKRPLADRLRTYFQRRHGEQSASASGEGLLEQSSSAPFDPELLRAASRRRGEITYPSPCNSRSASPNGSGASITSSSPSSAMPNRYHVPCHTQNTSSETGYACSRKFSSANIFST